MSDPALVHLEAKVGADQAGTHVLIIGIGAYDHLIDGPKENLETAAGMRQLTAPPHSARALAGWFLSGGFQNPNIPLASVAMVISEDEAGPYPPQVSIADHVLPDGNLASVQEAVDAWTDRCASHPDNLAIFYFSGHGVSSAEPLLLCRDFGASDKNPYRGAVNFAGLRGALSTRDPSRQIFLLDACRTPVSFENGLMGHTGLGVGILSPVDRASEGRAPAQQSVHFATSALTAAYGRSGGLTYYTSALLEALSGGGAAPEIDWWVGTNGLQSALAAYTACAAEDENLTQLPSRAESASFKIHKPNEIRIPLNVTCDPPSAWGGRMSLMATSTKGSESLTHDPAEAPQRQEWSPRLPTASYVVTATDGLHEVGREDEVLVVPPFANCRLRVRSSQ